MTGPGGVLAGRSAAGPAAAAAGAAAAAAAAAAAGIAVVSVPMLALLPVALVGGWALVTKPRVRILFVVFGAIFAFGTTDELTPTKIGYVLGVAAATLGLVLDRRALRRHPGFAVARPLLIASVALGAVILLSFAVAASRGVGTQPWLRDATPYVLFALAPFFAIDAARAFSRPRLEALLVTAGTLGALSFALTWMSRRGIATFDAIGFPTILLPSALFAYAMSVVLGRGRRIVGWLVVAAVTFGLVLSTGTRTTLVLVIAPLAVAFGSLHGSGRRVARLVIFAPIALALVVLALQLALNAASADEDVVRERIEVFFQTGSEVDRSYLDRLSANASALDQFRSAPLFGIGLGTPIPWVDSFGVYQDQFIDSPIAFAAKFGIVGIAWLALLVACAVAFVVRARGAGGAAATPALAFVAFTVILVAYSLLQVPFDDKGLPIAMMLLVALCIVDDPTAGQK